MAKWKNSHEIVSDCDVALHRTPSVTPRCPTAQIVETEFSVDGTWLRTIRDGLNSTLDLIQVTQRGQVWIPGSRCNLALRRKQNEKS